MRYFLLISTLSWGVLLLPPAAQHVEKIFTALANANLPSLDRPRHLAAHTGALYGFIAENPKNFIETSLNLLSNRQYTFLSEYFSKYYNPLAQAYPQLPLQYKSELKVLIQKNPLLAAREAMLAGITMHWEKTYPKQRSVFHCLAGELALLREDYPSAQAAYTNCTSTLRYFYLGLIAKKAPNFTQSKKYFRQALKKPLSQSFRDEIYLSLAFMAYKEKEYQKAKDFLAKSTTSLRQRIALYNVYQATGEVKKSQSIIKLIEKAYPQNAEAKAFLQKNSAN